MMKMPKSGLILAMLMAGSAAHAAAVQVNLTGHVDYGYGPSINQGDAANVSFTVDDSAGPDYVYNYAWGSENYSYSNFYNAIGAFSATLVAMRFQVMAVRHGLTTRTTTAAITVAPGSTTIPTRIL